VLAPSWPAASSRRAASGRRSDGRCRGARDTNAIACSTSPGSPETWQTNSPMRYRSNSATSRVEKSVEVAGSSDADDRRRRVEVGRLLGLPTSESKRQLPRVGWPKD
jgi:hypothetical protein